MNRTTENDVKAQKVVSRALDVAKNAAKSTLDTFKMMKETRKTIDGEDEKAWTMTHAASNSVYDALVAVDAVKKVYSTKHTNAQLDQAIVKTNRMYNSISDMSETVDELKKAPNSVTKASLRNMVYEKANLAQQQAGEMVMFWEKLVANLSQKSSQEAGGKTRRNKKSRRSHRSRRSRH